MVVHRLWHNLLVYFSELRWTTIIWLFLFHFWVTYVGMYYAGEGSITDSFSYWYIVTTSTVGYGDLSPSTQLGKAVVALWVIPGGVALFTTIIGKAVNDIGEKTRMNREGKGVYRRYIDHILLVCDSDEAVKVLELETQGKLKNTAKVVLTTKDSDHTTWVKASSYTDKDAYWRAHYEECKRIVILLDNDQDTLSAVLTLAKLTSKPIIAYMKDAENAELIRGHFDNVEVVLTNPVSLVARSMADPGISSIFEALTCSTNEDTLYGIDAGDEKIAWKDIDEIERYYNCSVIAIQLKDNSISFINNYHNYIDTETTQKVFYIAKGRI